MSAATSGPWNSHAHNNVEIHMIAPRSALPVKGYYLLIAAGIAAGLVSLRFVLLGAWPVLVFSLLDIGALAVALSVFNKSPVPQERLRIHDGEIELVRSDSRGRQTRITLPAFWTRLEMSGRSEVDCDL
jgi:Integral membrane protein